MSRGRDENWFGEERHGFQVYRCFWDNCLWFPEFETFRNWKYHYGRIKQVRSNLLSPKTWPEEILLNKRQTHKIHPRIPNKLTRLRPNWLPLLIWSLPRHGYDKGIHMEHFWSICSEPEERCPDLNK